VCSSDLVLTETLQDAIDRAGGFREDAASVTVARRRAGALYSDTTSVLHLFPLDPSGRLDTRAAQFVLEPDDHVLVRTAPGFRAQRFVAIEGDFYQPGAYAITENRDRLTDVVNRAGGLLPVAYPLSFKLIREGKPVSVDFSRALRGDRVHNVLVRAGDVLTISHDPRTVFVTGAVSRPSLVVFRPGLSALGYIELAGGPTEKGNRKKAVVDYPAGYSSRIRSSMGVVYSQPEVVSGGTITVPERPEGKTTASDVWQRVFASASALASLVLAYSAVTR
jgi:protein involved in polysaccharide export with SLBB domain